MTLFSSIGSLFIDFLFVDVLSAPTIDTTTAQPTSTPDTATTAAADVPTRPQHKGDIVKSKKKATLLYEDEIRVVPHEFQEAHNAVISTAAELLEGTQENVKRSLESRKSVRLTRIQSQRQNGSPSPQQPQSRPPHQGQGQVSASSEELLSSLLMEIKEERGRIKKEFEREAFDTLWGYIPPSSCPLLLISLSLVVELSLRMDPQATVRT